MNRFPLLILALAISGCAVGPDYHQPAPNVSGSFQGESLLQARAGANPTRAPMPPLDTWWQGFADPQLEQLMTRVLAQNLDLAMSQARVERARAAAQYAGAERLPIGSLDAQVVRQRQSLKSPMGEIGSTFPGYKRNQTLQDIGVGASWELDLAGGLKRGAEAADALAQAAEAEHAGVRISVAAEAADAYFRVRGAQQRIALAEEQVSTQGNLRRLVQDRANGGLATVREQAQAQAVLLQAQATLPPLRIELARQLNRLDVLMGAQPGTYSRELEKQAAHFQVPSIASSGGLAELLRRRPDVIAAEQQLVAANAEIGATLAEYYPKVSLAGLLGFEALNNGSLLSSEAFQPQALLGLHWRLFDFGRVDAQVQDAKGRTAEALANYRQTMLRATEDVENAIVTLVELERQHADLKLEVAAHQQAREAAQDAYQGGSISLVEVLDEDRLLLTSRDQLAQVQADDARAAVAAFRALGGGWHAADDAAVALQTAAPARL